MNDQLHQLIIRNAELEKQLAEKMIELDFKQRDLEVEAALEKIRSRTMTMQRSNELREVVSIIYEQLQELGFNYGACTIIIMDKESGNSQHWVGGFIQKIYPESYQVNYFDHPFYKDQLARWKRGEKYAMLELTGEMKKRYDVHMFTRTDFRNFPEEGKKWMEALDSVIFSVAYMKHGALAWGPGVLSGQHCLILQRLAKVFEQTYTRFLDLQKAETLVREAQIEVALERVRARALAMQTPHDLLDVANVLREQMGSLGQPELESSIVHLYKDDSATFEAWYSFRSPDLSSGETITGVGIVPKNSSQWAREVIAKYESSETEYTIVASGQKLVEWYKVLEEQAPFTIEYDDTGEIIVPEILYYHFSNFSGGSLLMISNLEPTPGACELQKRAAIVFDLAYTRFLDLKKAEGQAREAQIEAALERVRSRTMAMHKSEELLQVIMVVAGQLQQLKIRFGNVSFDIIDQDHDIRFWMATPAHSYPFHIHVPYLDTPMVNRIKEAQLNGTDFFADTLSSAENKQWVQHIFANVADDFFSEDAKKYLQSSKGYSRSTAILKNIFFTIGNYAAVPYTDEENAIFRRFANVFEQAYTRFNDLQKAEAQTHKALIETALERVRARALAMQEPEELIEVARVLRSEMGLLGIEELESSSIYIYTGNNHTAECWFAIKDKQAGKPMVADYYSLGLNDTWVGRQMLQFFNSDANTTSIHMFGDHRREWLEYASVRAPSVEGFYGDHIPDRIYHLSKFPYGAIGAASPANLSEESWDLLNRAASVFSLAYSRFKDLSQARTDLVQLKEEKKRSEDAFTDLKATQSQLIQAEKMASLGALTAGIAHEIQNPLNFVNNFSEVNAELLEELKNELSNGSKEEAISIANDLIENEQKISHHGKRADAIVKGMLLHTRTHSGKKERTNINVLANEYLRLSYHNLRAKDSSFNATIETHFEESMEGINVIPQDIGRALLNLFNNAFYCVAEKRKLQLPAYEATVSVTTKKINDKIQIEVRDNGPGIPQNIIDKIFQPFFTTKPTGQGTGLGLSLSYDIIKAHGGEIKVETRESEGTVFIVVLPIV